MEISLNNLKQLLDEISSPEHRKNKTQEEYIKFILVEQRKFLSIVYETPTRMEYEKLEELLNQRMDILYNFLCKVSALADMDLTAALLSLQNSPAVVPLINKYLKKQC